MSIPVNQYMCMANEPGAVQVKELGGEIISLGSKTYQIIEAYDRSSCKMT